MSDRRIVTYKMWEIIMLMSFNFAPEEILVEPIDATKSNRDVLKYVFGAEAQEYLDAWTRGDNSGKFERMETIRRIKNVTEMFKDNLRRLL